MFFKKIMENKIYEVGIGGGPCSGKTTGIKKMQKKFTKDGYRVFIGREIATDVILGGVGNMAELAKKRHEAIHRGPAADSVGKS